MKIINRLLIVFPLAFAMFCTPKAAAVSIESGMCLNGSLSYLYTSDYYEFYAAANDTILLRFCNTDAEYYPTPTISIRAMELVDGDFEPVGPAIYTVDVAGARTMKVPITTTSWYQIRVYENLAYPYLYNYNLSFLRMPGYPLSTADLDVGPIKDGESLDGTLLSGDLDAAMFPVTNNCLVQLRMGQGNPGLVPNISLYDPYGNIVETDYPPEYRAEITANLTVPGIYTAVLRDNHDNAGSYYVSMVRIPPAEKFGPENGNEIGPIVHGETLYATINTPGDLDMAWFPAVPDDIVQVTMTKLASDFNPRIEIYSPDGAMLFATNDWFQTAAQATITCSDEGNHYIICKDTEDRTGEYKLHVELLGGPSTNNVPAPPAGIKASDGEYDDHILVSWNISADALGYEVWRYYGTNEITHITNTEYNVASFADYSAPSNTYCYYKVKSKNSYGTSAFSESDSGYYGVVMTSAKYRAILVGINNYDHAGQSITSLNGCSNDVELVKNMMLLDDASNRWDEANIWTFFDTSATKANIQAYLTSAIESAEPGDLIFYQQSSHGGTSLSDTFLCMYNANYTDTELAADLETALSDKEDVSVVFMLDACHSGGMFPKTADGKPYWPFAENVMAKYRSLRAARLQSQGRSLTKAWKDDIAFMTSANFDETCGEGVFGNQIYGFFSYYMAHACTNASVDVNADREFQFIELFDYAKIYASLTNSDQNAQSYNDELLQALAVRSAPEPGENPSFNRLRAPIDYDGDRTSDLAVYNYETGNWYVYSITNGVLLWDVNFGGPGFIPVAGDYDGTGLSDLAVYYQPTGDWYIYSLRNGLLSWAYNWGGGSFLPAPGDYDGDKRYDFSVYDRNTGYWYINSSTNNILVWGETWTGAGLEPVPGDFDSDKAWDIATYHAGTGHWFIRPVDPNKAPILWSAAFNTAGAMPISGDYSGNGITDLATYDYNTGKWNIRTIDGVVIVSDYLFGGPGFTPVAGDFDGDGKFDLAVYNESTGKWYIKRAASDTIILWDFVFGGPGFKPVRLNY